MPTRRTYTEELSQLTNDVIKMGSLIEESIQDVLAALKELDEKKAEEIIANDDKIDNMEHDIEKACITLIAKQQPVATDLRRITSILRIIADVERIADHCSDISEYIVKLARRPKIEPPKHVKEMLLAMKTMVMDTIDSFVTADVEKARNVIASDDTIDTYFEDIMEALMKSMEKEPQNIHQYVDYLMIIKYVERMADHSTNIAEWICFIVTGALEEH